MDCHKKKIATTTKAYKNTKRRFKQPRKHRAPQIFAIKSWHRCRACSFISACSFGLLATPAKRHGLSKNHLILNDCGTHIVLSTYTMIIIDSPKHLTTFHAFTKCLWWTLLQNVKYFRHVKAKTTNDKKLMHNEWTSISLAKYVVFIRTICGLKAN